MDFDYFYGRGADQFAFYQIPKILITDEKFAGITMKSKIFYSLMLDRASLSAKNGWLDEDGKVFIYYKLRSREIIYSLIIPKIIALESNYFRKIL